MKREGRAEVCEGADPYLVDRGGIGFPGVDVFIWACSCLLSEESRYCQDLSNTSTQPLTHCSVQAPGAPV